MRGWVRNDDAGALLRCTKCGRTVGPWDHSACGTLDGYVPVEVVLPLSFSRSKPKPKPRPVDVTPPG